MGNGPGVSLRPVELDGEGRAAPGCAWRVRWREEVEVDGQRGRKQRERLFHHPSGSRATTAPPAATKFQAEVLRALEDRAVVDTAPAVRVVVTTATFDAAVAAWMAGKAARGVAQGTRDKYAKDSVRWLAAARGVAGLAADAPLPIDMLSRDLFNRVVLALRATGLSESTVYTTTRVALDAWTWAADEPATFHGVPAAPRDKSRVLPQAPIYSAPPAPTLAEIDACIRRLHRTSYVARGAAIVMRYTGLRISQVLSLKRDDLDAAAMTITVRTGKSRRERSEHRVVPIPRAMLDDLAPYMGAEEGGALIRRRRDLRSEPNRSHHPRGSLTDAWKAATAAGEARRDVWAPSTRVVARPEHAFRAALQGHLVEAGARDELIDALVGHVGKSTRSRHYAGPAALFVAMREVVNALPPIDWQGPQAEAAGNVVPFRG